MCCSPGGSTWWRKRNAPTLCVSDGNEIIPLNTADGWPILMNKSNAIPLEWDANVYPDFHHSVTTQITTSALCHRHDFTSRMPKLRPKLRIRCPDLPLVCAIIAQPVVETATDQNDFDLYRITSWFCGGFIHGLSDQWDVNHRHYGHQLHVSSPHHSRRQDKRGHTVT